MQRHNSFGKFSWFKFKQKLFTWMKSVDIDDTLNTLY